VIHPRISFRYITQNNGAVSNVNNKCISYPSWASVHCQQWELSKFLTRYQQFASHAYCGAAGAVSKMALQQEKALCVLRFEVSRSVITVQREFKNDAPHKNNVTRWYRHFVETGCLCKGRSPGGPRVPEDNIERAREAFQQSPRKSVATASRELGMPTMTVWKVLRKRLCFRSLH
jgi:hypothetical protein